MEKEQSIDSSNRSIINKSTMGESTMVSIPLAARLKKRKLVVLGKMGVGKSSLLSRFVHNSLPDKAQLTHEDSLSKSFLHKNEEHRLNIIDTAGQSEYTPALPSRYGIGSHGFILTFSIDDIHSFEVIQHVNKILLEGIGTKYIPRILVGNKSDLESSREVDKEKIQNLLKTLKCPYVECSALNGGEEIDKIFIELLNEIDKEINDEYPYDIKNTKLKLNFITKYHQTFNLILLCSMVTQTFIGLFLFVYSLVISFYNINTFEPFLFLNLFFALIILLNSIKGFRAVKKQWHHKIDSVNTVMYIIIAFDLVLILLLALGVFISENLNYFFEKINPMIFYVFVLVIQIMSVYIGKKLIPLYKEFYSAIAVNQKLLIKD